MPHLRGDVDRGIGMDGAQMPHHGFHFMQRQQAVAGPVKQMDHGGFRQGIGRFGIEAGKSQHAPGEARMPAACFQRHAGALRKPGQGCLFA